jgi:hypothetical protein
MRQIAGGYTIIEVVIFLAISTMLFMWASIAIGGQQRQVQFSQSMRDIDSKIKDVINDVSTGYYPNAVNFECRVPNENNSSSDVIFSAKAGNNTGTSKQCVFLGKVMQFGVGGAPRRFNTYTVLGRRQTFDMSFMQLRDVYNLAEARPKALTGAFDGTERKEFMWGVELTAIKTQTGAMPYPAGTSSIAFLSTFARQASSGGDLFSGSLDVQVMPVPANATASSAPLPVNSSEASGISAVTNLRVATPPVLEPMILCFQDSNHREQAFITIGVNGRSTDTKLEFAPCP